MSSGIILATVLAAGRCELLRQMQIVGEGWLREMVSDTFRSDRLQAAKQPLLVAIGVPPSKRHPASPSLA